MELFATDIRCWDEKNNSSHLLDKNELIRLSHMTHPKRRREFIIGRVLIKQVLADLLGQNPNDILLSLKENRIPYLPNSDLYFSLSHSESFVLLAVSEYPVGIDIEQIKPRNLNRLKSVLTQQQIQTMQLLSDDEEKTAFFYRCWTMKEASFKLNTFTQHPVLNPYFLSGRWGQYLIAGASNVPLHETSVQLKDFNRNICENIPMCDVLLS